MAKEVVFDMEAQTWVTSPLPKLGISAEKAGYHWDLRLGQFASVPRGHSCLKGGKKSWASRARKRLWETRPHICAYCRKVLIENLATIDHVVPKARGGGNGDDNIVLACKACNQAKGDNIWKRPRPDVMGEG